jgi:hypothetical protein
MNRFLIAVQATSAQRTYPDFEDFIRRHVAEIDDCFVMPFMCILRTKNTRTALFETLKSYVHKEDRLIVAPLAAEKWMSQNAKQVDDCFETWP